MNETQNPSASAHPESGPVEAPAMAATPTPEAAPALPVGAPVGGKQRINALDVLRGLAILLILPANIPTFAQPTDGGMGGSAASGAPAFRDVLAEALVRLVVDQKMVTMLSILFGVGLALQYSRAKTDPVRFGKYYGWRMFLLWGLGILHGTFLWFGDILNTYGTLGLIALLLVDKPDDTLRKWTFGLVGYGVLILSLFTVGAGVMTATGLGRSSPAAPSSPTGIPSQSSALPLAPRAGEASQVERVSNRSPVTPDPNRTARASGQERGQAIGRWIGGLFEREGQVRVYQRGSYLEQLCLRGMYVLIGISGTFWTFGPYSLACFIIGIRLFRAGLFEPTDEALALARKMVVWGLAIGVPFHIAGVGMLLAMPRASIGNLIHWYGILPMALALIGLGVLWTRSGVLSALQLPFQAVGRLALSNYLFQTLVCTTLFYSYGLKLFGRFGRADQLWFVLAIWAVQIPLSMLWLRYREMGPVEMAWRRLAARGA